MSELMASRSNRRRQDRTILREERHSKDQQSRHQTTHFAGFKLKREGWGGGLVILTTDHLIQPSFNLYYAFVRLVINVSLNNSVED